MKKILVIIYFDIDHDKLTEDRDFDMIILEVMPNEFKEKLLEVIENKRYSWDDYEKMKMGYKVIMGFDTIDLTDIEIYK